MRDRGMRTVNDGKKECVRKKRGTGTMVNRLQDDRNKDGGVGRQRKKQKILTDKH